ncbi:hypothetical protein Bca101_071076 [Brassica carinata]
MMHDSSSDDDDSSSGDDDSSSSDDDSSSGGVLIWFSLFIIHNYELLYYNPLCFLWGFGEKVERWTKTAVGFLGSGSRLIFSLRSRLVVSVREEEERFGSFRALVDLRLGSRRSIGSGWFLSVLDGVVKHWVPLSLAVVCAGGFHCHGGESCA